MDAQLTLASRRLPARPYRVLRELLCSLVRLLVGAYPCGQPPASGQVVYFANHTSHLDTLTLLSALSLRARSRTRPVAALDYWGAKPWRRWVAENLLNVVLIDRCGGSGDPLAPVHEALAAGFSLILFPEGTRRDTELPGPFKSGLYHLARAHPRAQLTPVYLENLHRILPKGARLPLPLINKVWFGAPLAPAGDDKTAFLAHAHAAVCALSPGH
ncbi:lysophospholipid acyltransferase family protein [Rivihabitans pingtungensis]|uniref:lysophospholipid acyltransferase family protein n=1 Tax=Rivihabitans pingtungensis TaxID=1054498 RepID=UPI0023557CE5|nr:lysophospholipid acyltransferase family protein [Rivihabitans pingtungensis]MCK6438068.1 1-acyl-sn-glycerol-3-phosphate acyltransferase [Rivihabitans pingtungensis]